MLFQYAKYNKKAGNRSSFRLWIWSLFQIFDIIDDSCIESYPEGVVVNFALDFVENLRLLRLVLCCHSEHERGESEGLVGCVAVGEREGKHRFGLRSLEIDRDHLEFLDGGEELGGVFGFRNFIGIEQRDS